MKLSNLSVIFIVIAIPLILLLSYYISLQRDTINLQTSYNTKLLESTKEAIEAFEINTVEWNEAYSETEDSKRRDIMASINTFTTSLANNLGVSGTSKEFLLSNIPAVAFTLYDGFYIYSPSTVKETIKDEDGVTVKMQQDLIKDGGEITGYNKSNIGVDKGKILYKFDGDSGENGKYNGEKFTLDLNKANVTENKHILKPYISYSETVKNSADQKMIINYTLDNYVTIYGKEDTDSEYISKSGYLNLISNGADGHSDDKNVISISDNNFNHGENFVDDSGNLINNPIEGIKFSGKEINPELLTEIIAYKNGHKIETGKFNYVYEAEKDTKVYYDDTEGAFFRLNAKLEKVYIKDLTEPLYKKCTIPTEIDDKKSFLKVYMSLADGKWYVKASNGVYIAINDGDMAREWDELLYHNSDFTDVKYDYSAINYCVETYVFTNWVNDLNLEVSIKDEDGNEIHDSDILSIKSNNDPDSEESKFTNHKKEIIQDIIETNLNQAITEYSESIGENYKLPIFQPSEWDQILSNVSIITFLQNIPIGLKYYNNYAIATSTLNKEYVDPNEIYLYNQDDTDTDTIYHSPYCNKLADSDKLIGYRSIDFIYKDYRQGDETKYYFRHSDNTNKSVNQSCYYCLVQRALYKETPTDNKKTAYYTALARERYLQLESITIEQSDITVTKTVDKTEVEYGGEVAFTITITNNATVNDNINIVDYYDETIDIDNSSINSTKSLGERTDGETTVGTNTYPCKYWQGVEIGPGETITITLKGTVKGPIGSSVKNTVAIYAYSTETVEIATASVNSKICKKVKKEGGTASGDYKVILVLDRSASITEDVSGIQKAAIELEEILGKENVTSIAFAQSSKKLDDVSQYDGIGTVIVNGISTNYLGAFNLAKEYFSEDEDKQNYIIFMSDGSPTAGQEDFKSIPILSQVWNTIASVATGWVECIWEAENTYGLDGLLTHYSNIWPCNEISKDIWTNIMEEVTNIQSSSKIYTVYFNKSGNSRPIFGLKKIATGDEYYYSAENTEVLMNYFAEIANNIRGVDIDTTEKTSYGVITLEQVSKIKNIKVGDTEYDFSIFSEAIQNKDEEDNAELNLNYNEYISKIFQQTGDITIVY